MLASARVKQVAVCGFDAFNMESARAVVSAARHLGAPVFLQAGIESARYMGMAMAGVILTEAARSSDVEICIHLDHGPEPSDPDELREAIRFGFESIMVDGSSLPLEENIALCRTVAEVAHPLGICVEGELGRVSRNPKATPEEVRSLMTDPDQAAVFVERSGVDYLAVSVGSVSGFHDVSAGIRLDLDLLRRIRDRVACPLVFHGGTGIPADQLREAILLGVAKINVAHGFRKAFLDGAGAYLRGTEGASDPREALREAQDTAMQYAVEKIGQVTGRTSE
jgi:ketose-bisphosphate aldolase